MNVSLPLSFRMGILALTLFGWFLMYFLINQREVEEERRLDLGTELDRKTPYWPLFALVYFSTYIYVIQPFFVLSDARQFTVMLVSFVAISVVSSLIHATVPSKIERVEEVPVGGVSGWMLGSFQKVCKPYGNFPSMHVGLSVPVVAANYMAGGPIAGNIALVWGILIALSTLFTKQHYILDALAGLSGGMIIFALAFWLLL